LWLATFTIVPRRNLCVWNCIDVLRRHMSKHISIAMGGVRRLITITCLKAESRVTGPAKMRRDRIWESLCSVGLEETASMSKRASVMMSHRTGSKGRMCRHFTVLATNHSLADILRRLKLWTQLLKVAMKKSHWRRRVNRRSRVASHISQKCSEELHPTVHCSLQFT